MHIYASMQVYKYASMQVCKCALICKYASIQVCKYAFMQVYTGVYKKLNKKEENHIWSVKKIWNANKRGEIYMSAVAAFLWHPHVVWKYTSMQICKYASMHIYASIQINAEQSICPQLRHFY